MPSTGQWYPVLQAARACAKASRLEDDGFSAATLADMARIEDHIASAWMAKFCRWGYALRAGRIGRWRRYRLTSWGLRFRPRGARGR